MSTFEEMQSLAYPQTYSPVVAGRVEHRNILLVESNRGVEGVALRPFLLCQDWDNRVVIHWEDDQPMTHEAGAHRPVQADNPSVATDNPSRYRRS